MYSAATNGINMLKSLARQLPIIEHWFRLFHDVGRMRQDMQSIRETITDLTDINRRSLDITIECYLNTVFHENGDYVTTRRMNRFGYQVYSQNDEDGIIEEIFNRIGTTNKSFVEFGAGDGMSSNTTYLLLKDWTGVWIEARPDYIERIKSQFGSLISTKKLRVEQAFITAENIEWLLNEFGVPKEFDLLSIDIDGNDYWVWRAIEKFRPRAVVIEYNALFRPRDKWVMKYNPQHVWDGSSYQGASLKSLEILGEQKGYKLVGCNFIGVNAFFVREDLVGDKFFRPFTAESQYEPPRYYLYRRSGHRRQFREFETI